MNRIELQKFKNHVKSLTAEEFDKTSDEFYARLEREKDSMSMIEKIKITSVMEIFYKESQRRLKDAEIKLVRTKLNMLNQ